VAQFALLATLDESETAITWFYALKWNQLYRRYRFATLKLFVI